jgi:hypothetical protein
MRREKYFGLDRVNSMMQVIGDTAQPALVTPPVTPPAAAPKKPTTPPAKKP